MSAADDGNNFIDPEGELAELSRQAELGNTDRAIASALIDIAYSLRALAFTAINR